ARLVSSAGLRADWWRSAILSALAVVGLPLSLQASHPELFWPVAVLYVAFVIGLTAFVALREIDPQEGFRTWAGTSFAALYPSLLAFAAGITMLAPAVALSSQLAPYLDSGR